MPDSEAAQPATGRRKRIRRSVLLTLLAVAVAAAGTGAWLYHHFQGNLGSVDINAELGTDRPETAVAGSQAVLVLGSDSETAGPEGTGGSGSVMVIHLPGGGGAPTAVTLPRGLVVDRPECARTEDGADPEGPPDQDGDEAGDEDGNATGAAGDPTDQVPFHSLYATGGPACVVQTVEKMSAIRMDHYLEVDFAGFDDLVDALGGITVTTREPVHDRDGGLILDAGSRTLDGPEALTAVRTEQAGGTGATEDGLELQQRFLLALIHEVNRQDILSSPAKLYQVAEVATRSLTTDSDLGSLTDLVNFAQDMAKVDTGNVASLVLPVREAPAEPGEQAEADGEEEAEAEENGAAGPDSAGPDGTDPAGRDRVVLRQPDADAVWQALRNDTPVPPGALAEDTAVPAAPDA
ncbi:LCP family protein [Streptomyces sp. ACA25]|uniref:LCP family protein n=1 Tax=Streptomyces sp. ACA25 TaxID=3022596 RepID=UPI0023078E93|nr:LCP family protein [Streptomyces sp. ACA25]MDB1089153.1 LCP family protein [Streptomyces sp. ACA25]